ncbi:hypothetical protein MMC13_006737 [Lambiella insularis]|nr:hypothetical protein [Lambiella insularis]
MGVRASFDTAEPSIASNSIFDTYIRDATAIPRYSTGETADGCWQQSEDNDIWSYDPITISPLTPFRQFSSPPTPTTHSSSSSSLSSIWQPSIISTEPEILHPLYPPSMPPSPGKPMPCSCLVIMLQMLQNLHQNFPQSLSTASSDISTLNYAVVLDMNEDATACCGTMLRCSSCKAEDSIDSFIVLAALLRKVLSLTEAWVAVPEPRESSDVEPGHIPYVPQRPMEQEDERRLKREVAMIGIKKMEGVLVQLKQAGQMLRLDYERLTCTSLTVSLSARLKLAMAALDVERETPAA